MNSILGAQLNLRLSGVSKAERLASLIVLAREVSYLKRSLCYAGTGNWQQFREDVKNGVRPTWEKWLSDNVGVTDDTVTYHWRCGVVVLARLRAAGHHAVADLMENRPSNLTAGNRKLLVGKIMELGLRQGETASALMREFKALNNPPEAVTERSPSPLDLVYQAEGIKEIALGMGLGARDANHVAMGILARDFGRTNNPHDLVRYLSRESGNTNQFGT